jgi:hypothetical protein
MPLEIVDMRKFYKFENTIACKILRFVNYFASVSSGAILIAIAVDRYRVLLYKIGNFSKSLIVCQLDNREL